MSDWKFLNQHRVNWGLYASTPEEGFNGAFEFKLDGRNIRCIASDGMGWQHVSVSQAGSQAPAPWSLMCKIKDLFWEPEEWVCQFHPARSEYVNFHPGCLHLWRPTEERLPTPLAIMVGPKTD